MYEVKFVINDLKNGYEYDLYANHLSSIIATKNILQKEKDCLTGQTLLVMQ